MKNKETAVGLKQRCRRNHKESNERTKIMRKTAKDTNRKDGEKIEEERNEKEERWRNNISYNKVFSDEILQKSTF